MNAIKFSIVVVKSAISFYTFLSYADCQNRASAISAGVKPVEQFPDPGRACTIFFDQRFSGIIGFLPENFIQFFGAGYDNADVNQAAVEIRS